jgi:hypothetical protein
MGRLGFNTATHLGRNRQPTDVTYNLHIYCNSFMPIRYSIYEKNIITFMCNKILTSVISY